jgi:hypothetical protein
MVGEYALMLGTLPMNDNIHGRRRGLVRLGFLIASAAATGLWLEFTSDRIQIWIASSLLAAAAALTALWLVQERSSRRLRAVIEAFADREIAQSQRRKASRAAV